MVRCGFGALYRSPLIEWSLGVDGATTGAADYRTAGYQWRLTALLSLSFGFVLFDRNALSFLMPFVQPELRLSNTQVGLLSGGLSLTWAIAAFGIGSVAGRFGSRKQWLIASTVLFALCSFGSGVAASFRAMLGTRLLMGAAEGGFMPLSQALIATQVDSRRRGLAMGIAQGFGSSLMGSFVAPVVLVGFATAYGWRPAFFLAGVPALLTAVLMIPMIHDAPPQPRPAVARAAAAGGLRAALLDANIVRCAILSVCFVAYLVVTWSFMPQDAARATHAPLLTRDHGRIDWRRSARQVHDQVRGLQPWPGASTTLGTRRLIVCATRLDVPPQVLGGAPGEVVSVERDRLWVATTAGFLALTEVQLEGKRRMGVREFLVGHPVRPGTMLGAEIVP